MIVYVVLGPATKKSGFSDCFGVYKNNDDALDRVSDIREGMDFIVKIEEAELK